MIPTLNAARLWPQFHAALAVQCFQPDRVLVLDSESTDGTPELAQAAGYELVCIPRSEFNHGGTRQLAAEMLSDTELLVYLTQDAILAAPDGLRTLVRAFDDPMVAAAYGRQLPRQDATPIEAHARFFNYPACSEVRSLASREQKGFKAIFISNSFAAYRRRALTAIGGFPRDVIFGEDTITAAKLLLSEWKIAYVADAAVQHSHDYKLMQEFKRYFDIGVLHARENWLISEFGHASGEGLRFVQSELSYLWPKSWWLVPSALLRTFLKLVGYRLGRNEANLSSALKRHLSLNSVFWNI